MKKKYRDNGAIGAESSKLQTLIAEKVTFRAFFKEPNIHPNAHMIKGVFCGYRIEEIEDEFEVYKRSKNGENSKKRKELNIFKIQNSVRHDVKLFIKMVLKYSRYTKTKSY